MGGDPLTLGIAGATIMGSGSVAGAMQTNRSIGRAMRSTVSSSQTALNQLQLQTAASQQRYVNQARRIRGALRVAAAAGGVNGADIAALVRQNAYDENLNTTLAKIDSQNRAANIVSQTQAALTNLENQSQNPVVRGALGAIQGFTSGYSLGGMFSRPTQAAGGNMDLPFVNRSGEYPVL